MHRGGTLTDLLRLLHHVFIDLGRLAAHLDLHLRTVRDDVAPRACVERPDVHAGNAGGVARDRVESEARLGCREERILSALREAACVGCRAGIIDVVLRVCERAVGARRDVAVVKRAGRRDVISDQVVDVVEVSVGHDSRSAAAALLARLKNQLDRAMKCVAMLHEKLRHAEADRRMRVMATGVHHTCIDTGEALAGRAMRRLRALDHAERVDVKAKRHHRAWAAVEDGDRASEALAEIRRQLLFRHALLQHRLCVRRHDVCVREPEPRGCETDLAPRQHLIAERAEPPHDDRRRPHLEPARLRMPVKITPQRHRTRLHRRRLRRKFLVDAVLIYFHDYSLCVLYILYSPRANVMAGIKLCIARTPSCEVV